MMEQTQTQIEICTHSMVRRVAAMLDLDPQVYASRAFLPRGWHFFLLSGETRRSLLREDGFPGPGLQLPDLGLPRLVLGSRRVNYGPDISIGSSLKRSGTITEVREKQGQSGRIAIVTVQHQLQDVSTSVSSITETQTFVLSARKSNQPSGAGQLPSEIDWSRFVQVKRIVPDETMLFHYSALGFNSHKIHLDRDFARNSEGFPDLVVNGGLSTLFITEFVRKDLGMEITEITVKHLAPLFCNRELVIAAQKDEAEKVWRLSLFDDRNILAVDANIVVK